VTAVDSVIGELPAAGVSLNTSGIVTGPAVATGAAAVASSVGATATAATVSVGEGIGKEVAVCVAVGAIVGIDVRVGTGVSEVSDVPERLHITVHTSTPIMTTARIALRAIQDSKLCFVEEKIITGVCKIVEIAHVSV